MLPGWIGLYPQLAAMSTSSLLSGNAGSSSRSESSVPSPLIRTPAIGSAEEQKEKERAVVVRALREIAEKKAQEELEKRADDKITSEKKTEEDIDKKPRCHLHRKPNAKCKKCQAVLESQKPKEEKPKAEAPSKRGGSPSKGSKDREKQHFSISPMLKEQVVKCSYFRSLQEINSVDGLAQEISEYADTLDVYNPGSKTEPSCFICQVLRLSQLPHIEDDMHFVLENRHSDRCRCVALLYLRFVTAPSELFDVFEEYLLDDMELRYTQDGQEVLTTIGEYAESLLVDEKYFETPLPRIPVMIRRTLEERVAPMAQFRKRMEANKEAITNENVYSLPVEVYFDGKWHQGTAEDILYANLHRPRVRVTLGGTSKETVKIPLGKVIVDDHVSGHATQERDRSRSPRGKGPRRALKDIDWSRHKGKSEQDMVEELRQRLRDKAVCGPGRSYAKRPLSFDASMSSTALPHVGEPGSQDEYSSRRRRPGHEDDEEDAEIMRRIRQAESDRRAKQLHNVYQKYCTTAAGSSSGGNRSSLDVDRPDVLRLG